AWWHHQSVGTRTTVSQSTMVPLVPFAGKPDVLCRQRRAAENRGVASRPRGRLAPGVLFHSQSESLPSTAARARANPPEGTCRLGAEGQGVRRRRAIREQIDINKISQDACSRSGEVSADAGDAGPC